MGWCPDGPPDEGVTSSADAAAGGTRGHNLRIHVLLPIPTRVNIVAGAGEQGRSEGGAEGWSLLQAWCGTQGQRQDMMWRLGGAGGVVGVSGYR